MSADTRKWTVMVYMAGDNGHEFDADGVRRRLMAPMTDAGYTDIAELASVGSTDDVALLVQIDTLCDQGGSYRLCVRSEGEKQEQERLGAQNTGNPAVLRHFLQWGMKHFPAERYAVVLWNHGMGWKDDDIYAFARKHSFSIAASQDEVRSITSNRKLRRGLFLSSAARVVSIEDDQVRGICYDDSSMDFLDSKELQQVFRDVEAATGRRIDLIGMDACLMSMVEVAYQLREHAAYLVASQEVEPLAGWPYAPIVQALATVPELTPGDLAKLIVREYHRAYGEGNRGAGAPSTQSAVRLAQIHDLAQAVGQVAAALKRLCIAEDFDLERALLKAQRKVLRFRDDEYVDVHDLFIRLRQTYAGDDALLIDGLDAALAILTDQDAGGLITANAASGMRGENAHGLSIYFPDRGCSPFYADLDFERHGWGDFIRMYNGVSS